MRCPKCGDNNCQIINETTTKGKDFSVFDAICGYIILGPIGLLCGACGNDKEVKKIPHTGYAVNVDISLKHNGKI